jgi:rubrerythrin
MGRRPRRASALRGKIDRLVAANHERNEKAQIQRDKTKISIELVQRIFQLVQRLSKVAHIANPMQLDFVRQGMPAELSVNTVQDLIGRHQQRTCEQCAHSLQGLPSVGQCPECNQQYQMLTTGWDFTAADLYQYATSHQQTHCKQCNYPLRGLAKEGTCPECGDRFKTGAITWEELCQFLADELAIPLDQVNAATRIVERLTQCSAKLIEHQKKP